MYFKKKLLNKAQQLSKTATKKHNNELKQKPATKNGRPDQDISSF